MLEQDIKRVLFGAKFLLGKNGVNWHKGPYDGPTKYCILSAVQASLTKLGFNSTSNYLIINGYLKIVVKDLGFDCYFITSFNDDPKTTWDNINEVLTVAIDRIKPLKI